MLFEVGKNSDSSALIYDCVLFPPLFFWFFLILWLGWLALRLFFQAGVELGETLRTFFRSTCASALVAGAISRGFPYLTLILFSKHTAPFLLVCVLLVTLLLHFLFPPRNSIFLLLSSPFFFFFPLLNSPLKTIHTSCLAFKSFFFPFSFCAYPILKLSDGSRFIDTHFFASSAAWPTSPPSLPFDIFLFAFTLGFRLLRSESRPFIRVDKRKRFVLGTFYGQPSLWRFYFFVFNDLDRPFSLMPTLRDIYYHTLDSVNLPRL